MAGCLIPTGITSSLDTSCNGSIGGLLKVYLGNKSQLSSVRRDSNDQVTGITMSGGGKAYLFEFEEETGSALVEALQPDSGFVQQTINFTLRNMTQEKKQILSYLKKAKMFAVVQHPNSSYQLAGETLFGLKSQTLERNSGQAITDIAAVTVSLQGATLDFADEVLSSALTSILA
jgi:hypothetical protein